MLSIRTKLVAAFCVALLLIVVTGAFSWSSTIGLVANAQMVDHTHEVLVNLERILSQLKDAETGQRGFVITGEFHYLEPYGAGLGGVELAVANVRKLTSDNPSQQRRLDDIEPLIRRKLDELSKTINLRRDAGFESALEVILTDAGKRTMDDLRAGIAEMEQEERRLLEQRAAATASTATKTKFAVIFGTIVSTAIFGTIALFLSRANSKLEYEVQERKRAEQRLVKQARELGRSNRELQQFANVASHDLQEPLRKISAFGDLLEASATDGLTEQGRDYVRKMQGAAARMSTLIEDLLTLSRVASKAQPFVAVDLATVAREVVADLEVRIEETGGRVEVVDLPTIEADRTQMRQLLQNLIANALKFHRPGEPPLVRVRGSLLDGQTNGGNGVRAGEEMLRLTVEDNGIGFDETYLDRIFTVFQRLHSRGEYEGSGVGLAVCRKIVDRHAGTITAKSELGRGSTFIATIPVNQRPIDHPDEEEQPWTDTEGPSPY